MSSEAIVAVITFFGGLVFKMLWDSIKEKKDDSKSDVKELNKTIQSLIPAVTRLEVQMEHISNALNLVHETRRDLDKLGSRVRELHALSKKQ